MKRMLLLSAMFFSFFFFSMLDMSAQSKKTAPPIKEVPVTLGTLGLTEMNVTRNKFLENAKNGLIDMSSIGGGVITGFHLTVITHNLYEDSLGAPTVMQDIYTNFVTGYRFDDYLMEYFTEKLKVGDTVFLDKISVKQPSGTVLPGISRKFTIVRKP